jgi:hypothetical protein
MRRFARFAGAEQVEWGPGVNHGMQRKLRF